MRFFRRLLPLLLLAASAAALALPTPASASHEQGGSITARITPAGKLQGTLTYLQLGSCTTGTNAGAWPITIKSPLGTTATVNTLPASYTRCVPNSTTLTATFDVDLAGTFNGVAPDGAYEVTFSTCCRVSGIRNVASTATLFRARVTKNGLAASGAPDYRSSTATGVAKGYDYDQNMNAFDPDGGSVTYTSLAGTSEGPSTDVITLGASSGRVFIPAATTSTWTNNWFFVYKIRATDAQGDYSERDVLLRVTGNNAPPSIAGIDSTPYRVTAGQTRVISFSGTDPNNASPKIDSVSLLGVGLPAWATLQVTAGNPATGTLTLSPPADTPPGTFGFSVDAIDSDTVVPLTAAAAGQIEVVTAPPPDTTPPAAPTLTGAPSPTATSAVFTFNGPGDAASFECSVDGGAWAACASPFTPAGLADGAHTVRIRALDAAGNASEPVSASWTLDTVAPAAPSVLGAVRSGTTAATFEFAGEPGGSFECRVDGGAWAPCASPHQASGIDAAAHSLGVRQTDAAGNVGAEASTQLAAVSTPTTSTPTPEPTPEPTTTPEPPATVEAVLAPNATVAVRGDSASVGCSVASGAIDSCYVDVFARDRVRSGGDFSVAADAPLVLIGRGRVQAGETASTKLAVDIELNAVGRRLMAESFGGLQVVLKIEARVVEGPTLRTREGAKLVPERQLIVPASGLFASERSKLLPTGKRALRDVTRRLDRVKSITCVGHTDSLGRSSYNRQLGLSRAKTVCATLKKLGMRGKMSSKSAGESRPRATNRTAAGRALNRRVELIVRYR